MTAVIDDLVGQFAEQAAFVWTQRARAVHSPAFTLTALGELDERLAAYIEGLHVSGAAGRRHASRALLEHPGPGEAFVAAVLALETCDAAWRESVIAAVETVPDALPGLVSAFGWVEPAALRGIVPDLLAASSSVRVIAGLAACALHRVVPGSALEPLLAHRDPVVRARALRLVGEAGAPAWQASCIARLDDEHPACRSWAAWSAVLLGDRGGGMAALAREAGARPGGAAFELLLQALPPAEAHAWLRKLCAGGIAPGWLLRGSGRVGDAAYVPWLLDRMADSQAARPAGEAFTLITGADLEARPLRGRRPADAPVGPVDDPDDPDVSLDAESDLPWPDIAGVTAWWQEHRADLAPGVRRLLGQPVTPEHARAVLSSGARQPQRTLAARALALLAPGQPLFDTAAPAPRQAAALGLVLDVS
jgi:uncharacterized protein (TIGR02270 family)